MRQLVPPVPHGGDVTALEALADPPVAVGRPAVRVCMVQSLDGVIAVDGRSGPLGSAADRAFFLACRALADVVLVGAQTMRAEGYGPATLTPHLVNARLAQGKPPVPRIAVVTRGLQLDLGSAFFRDARARPVIVTCASAPHHLVAAAREVADVIVAGNDEVDMRRAVAALGTDGCHLIDCEGGPTLNGALARAGLIDELCLSFAPTVIGDGPRLARGLLDAVDLHIHSVLHDGDALFVRLRPAAAATDDEVTRDR